MNLDEIFPEDVIPPKELNKHANFAKALIEYKQEYADQYALYEGLILTHPRGKSISVIKNTFPNSINFQYNKEENDFRIYLHHSRPIDIPKLFQLLNNLGWFITEIELDGQPYKGHDKKGNQLLIGYDFKEAWLSIQAKYDIEEKSPDLLYHATPANKTNKILQLGLSPKTQAALSYHPDRVYLTTTPEAAEGLLPHLGQEKKVKQWSILEINTTKIPRLRPGSNITYFRLFKDPSFPHQGKHVGLYTLSNIPPVAIRSIKVINIP